jgi:hypothetical protein
VSSRPTVSKQDAVDRLHRIMALAPQPLGPGSKEHKRTFERLAHHLGLTVDDAATKVSLAEQACRALGRPWDASCYSVGDTITGVGIARILAGMEELADREGKRVDPDQGVTEEDLVEDERLALEWGIAEHLAALSEASEAPTEFEPAGRAFGASDVDFSSNGWMASLAEVQGWLRLDYQLDLVDPLDFVGTLVRSLGFDDRDEALEDVNDVDAPRLSMVALERLRERAERSLRLQQVFTEALESEDGSQRNATARWREQWEDEPEEEESTGPVSAKALTWPINEFSDRAVRKRLNLSPSYQRGDVWPTGDSQMLIESILRGIPLPSVIILKSNQEGVAPYEVVDGKQRLTAILRFIGKHPRAVELVDEVNRRNPDTDMRRLFEEDYPAFRRAWKNLEGEQLTASKEREYYFPFKLRQDVPTLSGPLAPLAGKYYTQIKRLPVQVADDNVEVGEIFERVTEYKIPVIEYSKATSRQIHEVFNLYNKQGKHLNAEEIRNAVYHELDFMRALIVASGDNQDVQAVAPFLAPAWDDLGPMHELLDDYGFGVSRYRRTKVLSWLCSLLFLDNVENGKPRLQSTARQIDSLLQRIKEAPRDPLRQGHTISAALLLVMTAMDAHAAVDEAWAPRFKDTKAGTKWQELQLVASLLGVAMAAVVFGDETADRLADAAPVLAGKTATKEWERPEKTQTGTQWHFIATRALWIAHELGVDANEASHRLAEQFGQSGITAIQMVAADDRRR